VGWNKEETSDERPEEARCRTTTVVAAETLRSAAAAAAGGGPARAEERISVFWRVFGGTLLSIVALVVVTVYQQFSSSLADLRGGLERLNESRADLVKAGDFNSRMTSVWTSVKDLQTAAAAATVVGQRVGLLEQQVKMHTDDMGNRLATLGAGLQDLRGQCTAAASAKERVATLEQQLKASDAERKDQAQVLQQLRERIAALEGRQTAAAPTALHRDSK
jgi:hypothetical protein